MDELLNDGGTTLDLAKRKSDYAVFAKVVSDELPVYIIEQNGYYTATSKKVGNVPT